MYKFPSEDKSTFNYICHSEVDKNVPPEGLNQAYKIISRLCTYIDIYYHDRVDYLMQFSFYLRLKSELPLSISLHKPLFTSYVSAGIDRDEVTLRGYQAAIHYTAMHNVHKFNKFSVLLEMITDYRDAPMSFEKNYYYLSLSKTLSCPQKFNNNFEITVLYNRILERYNLMIDNQLIFRTSYSYFKLMDSLIMIITEGFPLCDVVVNFQVVNTNTTDKSQETCNTGFLQVSLL